MSDLAPSPRATPHRPRFKPGGLLTRPNPLRKATHRKDIWRKLIHRAQPQGIEARKQRSGRAMPDTSLAFGNVLDCRRWPLLRQRWLGLRSAVWSPGTITECNSSLPRPSASACFWYSRRSQSSLIAIGVKLGGIDWHSFAAALACG
jgi:hypothetical protein